jgi:protein SCO1/2
MQDVTTFSTNKIIMFTVFIAAAIMTSLFVYHTSHKPEAAPFANNSIVFPAPRDIKPVELFQSNNEKLPKTVFMHHWTLLFFGFTHCNSICPTTLDMLNHVYVKLHAMQENLQVVFISLDPERDTPDALSKYVHGFNPAFISATGKLDALRKLQSQLGIFSAQDETTPHSRYDYQIQHTPSILLIDPNGKWAGMFNSAIKPDELIASFQQNVKILSEQHTYA